MARNREDIAREVAEWKNYLSNVESIPMNPNLTYNDENDVYERLTEFVKDWVEGMFGVAYTPKGLTNIADDEMTTQATEWLAGVKGRLTPLAEDWYQFALNGLKEGDMDESRFVPPLPTVTTARIPYDEDKETAQWDIREGLEEYFLPAYRALRDTFNKGWFFKWLFNHRQYVAERDALKVMTNVMKSMGGYTQKELDAKYAQHKKDYTREVIENANTIEFSNREVDMRDAEEETLFANEERYDQHIDLKSKRVNVVRDDELFTDEKRFDDYFMSDDQMEEIDNSPIDDEPIIDNLTASEKIEKFDDQEQRDALCTKFWRAMKTTEANEESIYRALHIHMYKPLLSSAELYCTIYDSIKTSYQGEEFKKQFEKITKSAVKGMFETVFKVLGTEDEREIVQTVKGKEVREKIGGSVFGIATLKDRIVAAQKITNIMLKNRTPIGFYPELAGDFGKSYHLLENTETLISYLKTNYADKYGESEINAAVKLAKNEASVKFRGAEADTAYVYEIGYRPDPTRVEKEKAALGEAQKMMTYGYIKDEKLKAVISENANRWKQGCKMLNADEKTKAAAQKAWVAADKKLAESYKDYDAKVTEEAVKSARVEHDAKKAAKKVETEQINVDLKEPKADTVPPVQPKPAAIKPPQIDK